MSAFEGEALEVLRSIRDEVRSTNARLDETNLRLDQTRVELSTKLDETNLRLDQTRVELTAHIDAVESAVVELSVQQRFMVRSFDTLARRDHRLDREVEALRERVERVEDKLGLDEPER